MARKARAVLVARRLEPDDVTTYAEHLLRGLVASGAAVEVLARGGEAAGRVAESGARVSLFPRLGTPLLGLFANARAAARAAAFAPQVLHAVSPGAWPAATVLSRALGLPIVVTFHDLVPRPHGLPWRPQLSPHVIALSESQRENLVNDAGVPKARVTVVPMGLDLALFPERGGVEEDAPTPGDGATRVVGCIAPLEPRKGVSFFIRAAKRVTDARGDVEFIVAGSGSAEGDLRGLARELGVRDRLTFVSGDVRAAEVLQNLDVFVFPALRESFGIPALEAMASGVPVVACGSGGTFELVRDGETGYLVPPGDERSLAERILALLADDRLRRRVGAAGRETVESDFALERMVEGTLAVYERAAEEGKRA
ncbi:MAG: glycosyltransferase family 4 protein [Planctomycetota bacterium]